MGSYLEIDRRETNNKSLSNVLISAIRDVDSYCKTHFEETDEEYNFFTPEYYNETTKFGCGDWRIKQKGIALLLVCLKGLLNDDEQLMKIAIERHLYFLENCAKEEELEECVNRFAEDVKRDVAWLVDYVSDILTDMVLEDKDKVAAHWV